MRHASRRAGRKPAFRVSGAAPQSQRRNHPAGCCPETAMASSALPLIHRACRALAWLALLAVAWAAAGARAADEQFLDPEQAFQFSARAADDRTVEVLFKITPGYYLYRERFSVASPDASLGAVAMPAGKVKFDETFQKDVETYRTELRVSVPVEKAPSSFVLNVVSQGCADAGLCYPPMTSSARVSLVAFGGDGSA